MPLLVDIVGSQQKTSSATICTGVRSFSRAPCSRAPLGRHHCHPKDARPLHRGCRGRGAQCRGGTVAAFKPPFPCNPIPQPQIFTDCL